MEIWEIILGGFIFLLFIVGVCLTIYFLYNNSKKPKPTNPNDPTDSNDPNNPINLTPPTNDPTNNPINPSGGSKIVPGNFSIQSNSNSNYYLAVTNNNGGLGDIGSLLKVILTNQSTNPCSAYSWKNVANFPTTSRSSIPSAIVSNINLSDFSNINNTVGQPIMSGTSSGIAVGLQLPGDTPTCATSPPGTSCIVTNLIYDSGTKRWCSGINPNYCLYNNVKILDGVPYLGVSSTTSIALSMKMLDDETDKSTFEWNNVPVITNCS